jgi:hypothetical protein
MPAPADATVLARREQIAARVRKDLAAAGLPLVVDDAEFGQSGAHVYVDTLDDDSGGGVFVAWYADHVLRVAAMDAVREGRQGDRSIELAGKVSAVMQDAIAEILSEMGYTVVKNANDMAPFHLLVTEQQVTPSGSLHHERQRDHE